MIAETATGAAHENGVRVVPSGFLVREFKKLALHSSHYFAGLIGGLLLGLISFPIFTRVFSAAEYGLIDLAQKVLTFVVIVSKMGLQNAALRFYDGKRFAEDRGSARTYYSTMFFGIVSTSVGVALISLGIVSFTRQSFARGAITSLMHLILILAVLRALDSMLWSFLRIEERTKAFNIASVGVRAAGIAAICILLTFNARTARTFLLGLLIAEAGLVAALSAQLLGRRVLSMPCFAAPVFRSGIAFGLPLVVYELAFAVLGSADRFLVRHYLGATALGSYSVASTLAQHANELLLVPLFLAIVPIYMRLWNDEGRDKTTGFLAFALDLYLLAAVGLLAMAAACAQDGVVLLASAKYAGAGKLIPLLLAGLLVYATHVFVAAGLLIHKRTLQMAGVLLISAALGVGLQAVLLPRLGLVGGALATLLSYSFCMLSLWWASNRVLPLRVNLRSLLTYVTAAAIAWLAAGVISLGVPVLNVFGKSATAFVVYAAGLYVLDRRVRGATVWVVVQCRNRIG